MFYEGEILLGQSEDGNARQVDFLTARELQEQVERSLEAIDIDDERGFALAPIDPVRHFKIQLARHESPLAQATHV